MNEPAMSGELRRRYRRLLRLYPRTYRAMREAEMLDTLVENAPPGQQRPVPREVAALVLGSLRVQAGVATRGCPSQVVTSAIRLGTLFLLAHAAAASGAYAGRVVFSDLATGRGLAAVSELGHPAMFLLSAVALWAVAAGRYRLGIASAGAAFAAQLWAMSWLPSFELNLVMDNFWQLPLAILATVPMLWLRPAASARPALWLLAIPAAAVLLPTQFDATLGLQPYATLAAVLGCLLWTVVDRRAPIAAGLLLLGPLLTLLSFYLPLFEYGRGQSPVMLVTYAATTGILLALGALLARRQVRL
jgi:hypothetical protein